VDSLCVKSLGHKYKLKKSRYNASLSQHFFSQLVIDRWKNLSVLAAEAPGTPKIAWTFVKRTFMV